MKLFGKILLTIGIPWPFVCLVLFILTGNKVFAIVALFPLAIMCVLVCFLPFAAMIHDIWAKDKIFID